MYRDQWTKRLLEQWHRLTFLWWRIRPHYLWQALYTFCFSGTVRRKKWRLETFEIKRLRGGQERERERESVCVCVCVCESERESLCVRESERERERKTERERESERERGEREQRKRERGEREREREREREKRKKVRDSRLKQRKKKRTGRARSLTRELRRQFDRGNNRKKGRSCQMGRTQEVCALTSGPLEKFFLIGCIWRLWRTTRRTWSRSMSKTRTSSFWREREGGREGGGGGETVVWRARITNNAFQTQHYTQTSFFSSFQHLSKQQTHEQ